jgi:hypothetical protein
MVTSRRGYGTHAVVQGVLSSSILLLVVYHSAVVNRTLQWMLAVIGFAAPLALGVISIRYIVRQT